MPGSPLPAVLADPDDDGARLVLADWLQETGQAKAASLIRVQVERRARPTWDQGHVALRAQEQALVSALDVQARRELPCPPGVRWRPRGFRRGLLAEATFETFGCLRAHGAACASVAPLEHARVPWPEGPAEAATISPIPSLRELSLYDHVTDPRQIDWLARSPLLSTVERLHVVTCGLGASGLRRLLQSPWRHRLRSLRVVKNRVGNDGLRAIVEADLPLLAELEISERADDDLPSPGLPDEEPLVDREGARMLATSPCLGRLRGLSLSGHAVDENGLGMLLGSPQAAGLERLRLRCQLDGPTRVPFLTAAAGMRLRELDLGENLLDAASVDALRGPALRDLTALRLDHCFTDPRTFDHLPDAPWLPALRVLDLPHTDAEPLLEPLRRCAGLALRKLGLAYGFRYFQAQRGPFDLIDSTVTDTLHELDLSRNYADDTFAEALMASRHLPELQVLHLGGHQFGPAAAATLAASRLGKRLLTLDLDGPHLVAERYSW